MARPLPHPRLVPPPKAALPLGLLALFVAIGCAPRDRAPDLDATFFALGALYEYVGYRVDGPGDEIDTFDAGREAEAAVFVRHLRRAAAGEGIDTEIVVRAGAGGCTVVSSGPMKEYLVSRYPVPTPAADVPPGGPAIDLRYASREMLPDRRAEESWLAGVHLRFAVGEALKFANSGHKARLAAELLTGMGGRGVEVRQTPRGHYPVVFTVTFEPSPEITALFAAVDSEVEAARGDQSDRSTVPSSR